MSDHAVIKHPHVTEKAMDAMDFENKLLFVVDLGATKPEIAAAIEDRYEVTVEKVTTQVTADARKKATVQLSAADDAQDIASRIGVF